MVKHPKIQPFFHVRGHLFWQFENKETNGVSLSCLLWWWRHRSFLKISQDPPFCSFFWKAEQKVIFFLLRFKTVGIHSVKFVWNKCSIMCYYRDFLFFVLQRVTKKSRKSRTIRKWSFPKVARNRDNHDKSCMRSPPNVDYFLCCWIFEGLDCILILFQSLFGLALCDVLFEVMSAFDSGFQQCLCCK